MPAKKVCRRAAGSALLADEALVAQILEAVVAAVDVPVTLKIRTGTDREHRNGRVIAQIAEASGVQMLTVHGRTRADRFKGEAEYQTIADIVASVTMPVIANGDIDSADKARAVLRQTGAAGIMVGRAAQGQLWLPGALALALASDSSKLNIPSVTRQLDIHCDHLNRLYRFHGEFLGLRIARKHHAWFLEALTAQGELAPAIAREYRHAFNQLGSCESQLTELQALTRALGQAPERLAA